MDAAACVDGDDGALADEEIVVDHIVEALFGDHHGDIDMVGLDTGLDDDVDALLVGLALDAHALAVRVVGPLAVGPDVHRALGVCGHAGDHLKDVLLDIVQHFWSTSSMLHPAMDRPISWG